MPYVNGARVPWKHKVNVTEFFDDLDRHEFPERRDGIVKRLRDSGVFVDDDGEIDCTLDELADTDTIEYFDMVLDAVYDFADRNCIWIETHKR